ncbi:hypothetical protein FHU10_3831 [Serratia fonticola]|jgi:predicted alpha/beta hydrolase family esterase|uniref:Serine hydrolase family protein n=1 Tax=Serratia fonticola TaxID=47917 RepID=A0A542D0W8_SERFO|nr:alpha/beta fold hydrolase [Serratia fonticola]TQI81260.1 hypothetical protein FHU09_3876 [Serratia fonticola]TQI96716.1 hypothetical protein FHU11_2170 [Serratia fonticola]TVZ71212.1 hypothetical protein FHU10_3831 [Serratia fonticola]
MNIPYRVVIVHGFLSTPRHHWFVWLKKQLEKLGIQVVLPTMPSPRSPCSADWLAHLMATVPTVSRHTWFIGHSLGCVTLLHYLALLNEENPVEGAVLVSGFSEPVPLMAELNDFTRQDFDYSQLKKNVGQFVTLCSMNDDIVPAYLTQSLSRSLSAECYSFPSAGHFRAQDGFKQFPELLQVLSDYLKI